VTQNSVGEGREVTPMLAKKVLERRFCLHPSEKELPGRRFGTLRHKNTPEHGLRVFDNRVPRRIFGPKRDEVTGEWRKLHNEELHNLYSSPDIIRQIKSRRMRWVGHVPCMGVERKE
jgi:hypothetical protein